MSKQKLMKIAVVGGGPSALSFCVQLSRRVLEVESLRPTPLSKRDVFEIHIFEKRESFGPSLPWSTEVSPAASEVHTIHYFASGIFLDPQEPDAFTKWAIENSLASDEKSFGLSFPSRATVGRFFAAQAAALRESLTEENQLKRNSIFYIKMIEHYGADVINIHSPAMLEIRWNSMLGLKSSSGKLTENFNAIVIATGHIPSRSSAAISFIKQASPAALTKYIDQTIPASNLDVIPPDATVGIVGGHLTGVDVVLYLKARGHTGPMYLASRSGVLPEICPRNDFPTEPYELKHLTKSHISSMRKSTKKPVSEVVVTLLKQEFEEALGKQIDWEETFCPKDPLARLRRSVERYLRTQLPDSDPPKWQAVVYSVYRAMQSPDQLRFLFDEEEFSTSFFQDGLASLWCGYALWLPFEHAEALIKMADEGQLKIIAPLKQVIEDPPNRSDLRPTALDALVYLTQIEIISEQLWFDSEGKKTRVDFVVNAYQAPPGISELSRQDSELWVNLRDEGKLKILRTRPGNAGFEIDRGTFKLVSSQLPFCYVLGGPLVWFTSDITSIAVRARALVRAVMYGGMSSPKIR